MGAIEDAQRLATKVKRQQTQLDAYEQRIADLETRLHWYRIALDIQSGDPPVPGDDSTENEVAAHDIDPKGEPAAPPEGDLDAAEKRTGNREVVNTMDQMPGLPDSVQGNEESPGDDRGSRIERWLQRLWP